jgi:hypothetical protein
MKHRTSEVTTSFAEPSRIGAVREARSPGYPPGTRRERNGQTEDAALLAAGAGG